MAKAGEIAFDVRCRNHATRKRVRDIAERLALSESDFYRKQRVAVEEVARQLALMEEAELRFAK